MLIPYLIALLLYGMNISYYTEQMDYDGIIEEPNVNPEDVVDLSGVSLLHFTGVLFAIPCILCIQCRDSAEGLCGVINDWIFEMRRSREKAKKKRQSFAHRVKKTLNRWWRNFRYIRH
jgi:hypothetical protein